MPRLGCLLLLVLVVLLIVAFKLLPWYVLVGLVVVLALSAKFLGRWLVFQLFLMPFKAKGSVLRGATATVHSVEPAPPPPREMLGYDPDVPEEEGEEAVEEEEEPPRPALPREWYWLTVTIAPQPKVGGFQHWEPGELRLILPETRPMSDDEDDTCEVHDIEIEEEGVFRNDEGYKIHGTHKLRMRLAVRPGTPRLRFMYYFETFGNVELPAK
jgi:hypothetical protein